MTQGGAPTDTLHVVENRGWDPRITVCRLEPIVDAYVIRSDRFVVLLDTLINPRTASQALEVARAQLDGRRTLLVANTHADYDHCWGNQLFAGPDAIAPAPIIARREAASQFHRPEAAEYLREEQARDPDRYGEVIYAPPTVLFDERLTLDGGDLTFEFLATPGHAPGHISLWIPEISTLFTGDAAEAPFPFARSPAALPDLRRSLARMAALEPKIALYSHAPRSLDAGLLRENLAYFDRLEEHSRRALARGLSPDLDDAALIAALGLPFEEALGGMNPEPFHEFYRERGHAMQIRVMLELLG